MKISDVIATTEAYLKPYLTLIHIEFRERYKIPSKETTHEISVFFDETKLPRNAKSMYGNFFIQFDKGYIASHLHDLLHQELTKIGIKAEPFAVKKPEFEITVGRKKRKMTGNGQI